MADILRIQCLNYNHMMLPSRSRSVCKLGSYNYLPMMTPDSKNIPNVNGSWFSNLVCNLILSGKNVFMIRWLSTPVFITQYYMEIVNGLYIEANTANTTCMLLIMNEIIIFHVLL